MKVSIARLTNKYTIQPKNDLLTNSGARKILMNFNSQVVNISMQEIATIPFFYVKTWNDNNKQFMSFFYNMRMIKKIILAKKRLGIMISVCIFLCFRANLRSYNLLMSSSFLEKCSVVSGSLFGFRRRKQIKKVN